MRHLGLCILKKKQTNCCILICVKDKDAQTATSPKVTALTINTLSHK